MKLIATALFVVSLTAATASAQCNWVGQTTPASVVETCGNVGIGTTNPTKLFHMIYTLDSYTPQVFVQNLSTGTSAISGYTALNDANTAFQFGLAGSQKIAYGAQAPNSAAVYTNSAAGLVLMVDNAAGVLKFTAGGNAEKMRLDASGHLGIGVANPSSALHVAGDLRVGTNGSNTDVTMFTDTPATLNGVAYAQVNSIMPVTVPGSGTTRSVLHLKNAVAGSGTNQIDLIVDGNIAAKYQDVAEWVSAGTELEPATVVVLDPTHDDQVIASSTAYDSTVAGVVSSRPGLILGVGAKGKEQIATTGRVNIKVDATQAPIKIGDLLVTSDTPGMAMKSQPIEVGGAKIHRPGTVIGKALQALPSGRGEILVLLSLQ